MEIKVIGTYYKKLNHGGTEKVIALLVSMWKSMGYEVILFKDEKNDDEYELPGDIKQIVLNDSMRYQETRAMGWKELLEKNKIDIMVYHYWLCHFLKEDIYYFHQSGIPFILYTHGLFSCIYKYNLEQADYLHNAARKCSAVLSLCEAGNYYFDQLGCRAYLVNNPCDEKLIYAKGKKHYEYNIIWFGGSAYNKQPIDALKIFKLVIGRIPSATMTFVGEMHPDNSAVIYKEIKNLGLEDKVDVVGFTNNTSAYYENADLYLSTSDAEGFMFTLLEAQAYGIPTVMYELPYLPLVKNADGGIVSVPQKHIKEAADEIVRILSDTSVRRNMGIKARKNAESFLNADVEGQWKRIFSDISCNINNTEANKGEMMQLLIEHLHEGEKLKAISTLDYKVGNILLKFPRKAYWFFRKKTH